MRFTVIYLILVSFTFLSLTPAGVSLAELRADDGFELDELDLGLEEDEEESEEEESASKKDKKSEDEELDEEESSEDSEDSEGSEDSEDEEESPAPKKSAKDADDEEYAASGKKIMAFYVFEDSHTVKAASHVVAETASYLAASKDYDYVGTEAAVSSSSSSWLKNAKKNFEEGKALYDDLGIEEAAEKFKSALKYFEDNIENVSDMTLMSEIIFYLGASYELIDEEEQAASYFSLYLSINPDGQPGDSFSEEVVSAFDGVKRDRKSAGKGSVKVQSNIDGALVFIDGRIAGMTPATLRGVSEGKHYYRIHKNGFRAAGGSVSVRGGKTATINETLTKNSSASAVAELEEEMKSGFGSLAMIRKATDLAEDNNLSNVFVVKASLGADERLKYQAYMIDCDKKEFKKSEAVFDLPEKGAAAKSVSLNQFNKALVEDPYEYKPISDLLMEEADLLGLSDKPAETQKDDKEKKPVYKEWWLWTVVGVVVAGGVAAGVVCGLGKCTGGSSSGASLDINFQ